MWFISCWFHNCHIFNNTIMTLILYSITHACFCSWLIGLSLYVLFFGSFCSVKTSLWNDTSWIPLCHVIHKEIYVWTSFNASFIAILPIFVISNLTAFKFLHPFFWPYINNVSHLAMSKMKHLLQTIIQSFFYDLFQSCVLQYGEDNEYGTLMWRR